MNKRLVFFCSLFLLIVIVIYKSNFVMFKLVDFLDARTNGMLALRDVRNLAMDTVDDINPFKGSFWNEKYDSPIVNLKFSRNDLNHFDAVINQAQKMSPYAYYMPNEVNQPIDTDVEINGKTYKAELKIHGTNNPHFKGPKRSYSIKIRKKDGKQYPFGMRRFALVIPTQSNLIGLFTYKIAELLNMIAPQNFLVRVYINGIDQGIYHLEEKLNKTLLERNGLSGFDVVRSDDSWAHQYADNHGTMFSFDYSGLNPKYVSGKNLNQLVTIKKLLNSDDTEFIKQHVNIEKFIKYDVLRYIFGDSGHMTSNDNVKFIYNTSNGRLEPFFRIENHIEKIQPNPLTFSPERHVNIGMFTSNKLLSNLTKDDHYRSLRNQAIYDLIQRKEEVLSIFDRLMSSQLGVLLNDTTNELPTRYFKYEADKARQDLDHNFDFLEKYLDYGRVFVEIVKVDFGTHEISIKPDSNSIIKPQFFRLMVGSEYIGRELKFINSRSGEDNTVYVTEDEDGNGIIELQSQLRNQGYSLSLDDEFEPQKNTYKFLLKFDGTILDLKTVFMNELSQREILERDTYPVIVDESSYLKPAIPEGFEKLDEKTLIMRSGDHRIERDVVLPYGMNLVIEAGSKIFLGEGVSVLISGDFSVNGQSDDPVVVRSDRPDKPFGVMAAVGDGTTVCDIHFLDISGGSEDVVNGKYLSGALSLYNHDKVNISDSVIHDNHADDGLNVKSASIFIKDNLFYSNRADQVDIDSGFGSVIGNHFSRKPLAGADEATGIDSNGDGLDLSDSKVIIIRNQIDYFLDKGFSIGENTSAIVVDNTFVGNRSAVTAKDASKVYLGKNNYIDNKIDIEMYQKKLFFEHPSVFNFKNFKSNLKIRKTEESRYFKSFSDIDADAIEFNPSLFENLAKMRWVEYE